MSTACLETEVKVQTTSPTLPSTGPTWTDLDRRFMARALELARKGVGLVSPGPLVGCVIVDQEGGVRQIREDDSRATPP